MQRRTKCAGFSLIEVLMVLIMLVLAQGLAMPVLSDVLSARRVSTSTDAIFDSLILARAEAAKRNSRVVVCKSVSGDACSADGSWHQGWIVFHDDNHNGTLDAGEFVVRRESALPPSIRAAGNGPVSTYVSYTPYGKTMLVSGAFQAGTFTVCNQSSTKGTAQQIVINSSGRPRIARVAVSQCA
jgi:type IV fimbrial biogenesis protein FimT